MQIVLLLHLLNNNVYIMTKIIMLCSYNHYRVASTHKPWEVRIIPIFQMKMKMESQKM